MNATVPAPTPLKDRLEGSKTQENLHTALSGESQAHLRYTWFASKARKDGYEKVTQIFEETARNEAEHAEIWFTLLGGREDSEKNLEVAANGEHFEWDKMYREFAETAREEGFDEIAGRFERVAAIERRHEERYLKYQKQLADGNAFVKTEEDGNTPWICLACGQLISNDQAPEHCPTCGHPKAYFARFAE
jgi:rubrerythrin